MTMISILQLAAHDAYPALIAGLEAQFGRAGSVEIAARYIDAELADFHWQSRIIERYLGCYASATGDAEAAGVELDRVAILGRLRGTWFVAICIVDGEGGLHDLFDLRLMPDAQAARDRLAALR